MKALIKVKVKGCLVDGLRNSINFTDRSFKIELIKRLPVFSLIIIGNIFSTFVLGSTVPAASDSIRFNSSIPSEVNYGIQYFATIKAASLNGAEAKISAISKPDWLKLSSEPLARIFAGSEKPGFSSGMVSNASFFAPYALAANSTGSIFVADQIDNRIRKISPEGEVSTVAGITSAGYKDGLHGEARFDAPSGIAVDQLGYLYISDQNNHSIRKISPTGQVTTFAGSQTAGARDGKGNEAGFKLPAGICVDAKGFVYVADRGNNLIRVISPNGDVSTLAGSGKVGFADGKGKEALFNAPTGIAVDGNGNVYVADQVNNRIRKISPNGDVSTLAGSGEFTNRDGEGSKASFSYPTGIALAPEGHLYVTDRINHSLRKITITGIVSTVSAAFDDGSKFGVSGSVFNIPSGICFNKAGNLLIADYDNHNIKEIIEQPRLSGTPSKSQVGSYKIILKASNANGITQQEWKIVVKDKVSPRIVNTTPQNLSIGVEQKANISITFDEEVNIADSGSISIYNKNEILNIYDVAKAIVNKQIALSEDRKSLILLASDLPPASTLKIIVGNGIVKDNSNNLFESASSTLATWSFTTKAKQNQTVSFMPLAEMSYGDPMFKLGPSHSSEGLLISYNAEDPNLIFIKGDSARILNSGKTRITAVQNGDNYYLKVSLSQDLVIKPRPIVIRPQTGQVSTYGKEQPEIKFDLISGNPVNGDKFAGRLAKAKGDSVGVYAISIGTLSLGNNYQLKLEAGTLAIQKAALTIKSNDHTKIAGSPNPIFTCSYEGFVNGESPSILMKLPELRCVATERSFIGSYPIVIAGAEAKNYAIEYQSGTLKVLPKGDTDFELDYLNLSENMPAGTIAAQLLPKKQGIQSLAFNLVNGEGDTDNILFKISGNSIQTASSLDYEEKHQFFIRVKSAGEFGESVEKIVVINLLNVNEIPQMTKIESDAICAEGILELNSISAGPEKDQNVKVFVRVIGPTSKNYFEVSQPIEGKSFLSYNISDKTLKSVKLQIILKDDGGVLNGGVDSAVYNYVFKVIAKTTLKVISDKGQNLFPGTSTVLSVMGSGKFQWYFNQQKLEGENNSILRISAEKSGVYSVKVSSDGGCFNEGHIKISVSENIPVTCTNIITANADGINDSFVARNIEHFPGNELWIMNSAGKLVYNKKGYSNDWQATSNGSVLPKGNYYYLLDLGNNKGKLKGYISVIDGQ